MTYYRIISDKRIIDSIYALYKESKYLEYNYKDSEVYKTNMKLCDFYKVDYFKNDDSFINYRGLIRRSIFYETYYGIKYDEKQDAFIDLSDSFYDLIKNAVDILPQLLGDDDYDYDEARFISSDDFSDDLLKEMVRRNAIVGT